jgi:hypothetical protein
MFKNVNHLGVAYKDISKVVEKIEEAEIEQFEIFLIYVDSPSKYKFVSFLIYKLISGIKLEEEIKEY